MAHTEDTATQQAEARWEACIQSLAHLKNCTGVCTSSTSYLSGWGRKIREQAGSMGNIVRPCLWGRTMQNNCWQGCGEVGTLVHCWRNCDTSQTFWKSIWWCLRKTKHQITIWYTNSISGWILKKKWKQEFIKFLYITFNRISVEDEKFWRRTVVMNAQLYVYVYTLNVRELYTLKWLKWYMIWIS